MTEPRRRRGPGPGPVIWSSILLFAALFALLTFRLSIGKDPSLSSAGDSRPVKVRRVIRRRVVTTIVPSPGSTTVTNGPVSRSSTGSPVPLTTSAS
jgi:hypothetical protein